MNEHRTWETDMSDALDQRVRDLHEAPLSFEQVTSRARGIRRRRQAAVAGGILAVAAVLTPIAVITAGDAGRTDGVPPAATPSQTVTDSSSPALPDNGPTPMVNRLEGSTLFAGGTEYELPGTGYTRADLLGSEIVAFRRDDEGNGDIDVLTAPADGGATELVDSFPAVDGYVASPQGLVIAYKTPEGELMTRWDGGEVSFGSDFPETAYPAAITGGPNCNEEVDGCLIYLNDGGFTEAPIVVSSHGTVDTAVPDTLAIRDADDSGLLSLQISYSDTGSCNGLYDVTAGDYLFETCENTLGAISPSGGHVLAGPAYLDGLGPNSIAILDREGAQVAEQTVDGGFVGSQAWEDPGHVVYTAYADGGWSIWRLGIDGEAEQLTDAVPGDEFSPPVQFAG